MKAIGKRPWLAGAALAATGALAGLASTPMWAAPTVFPTGTTLYAPDKAWNGYTVLSILSTPAVVVIDMNGRVVKRWEGFNVSAGGPARILPGGTVIAPTGANPGHQESTALVAQDFAGRQLWRLGEGEQIVIDGKPVQSARQHHDWQRTDFPAGYYSPSYTPSPTGGRTLLLAHSALRNPAIADVELEDDHLVELDDKGKVTWEWRANAHIDELGYDDKARAAIRRVGARDRYDWLHSNSATYVGPNKWFDAGDKRFDPQNVIVSSRQSSLVFIVARDGKVVWKIGPDFSASDALKGLGQIIGQHHAHIIPPGLPGAGNMMIFDNGGASGLGDPSPISPRGDSIYQRANSRIIEFDPVTLKVAWTYTAPNFYSTNISGAQRLPNGNTLITEGAPGRIFEVTPKNEIVWEYMNAPGEGPRGINAVYRAYRVPYGWLPQVTPKKEVPLAPPAPGTFHVPGTPTD